MRDAGMILRAACLAAALQRRRADARGRPWRWSWVKAHWRALFLSAALALPSCTVFAADSGTLWSRETLTGNWGGAGEWLSARGIELQLEFTEYYQGLISGSGEDGFESGGRADAFVDFDTAKLGLWDGGGLHTHFEYRFGGIHAFRGGALWPVNTGAVLPLGAPDRLVATSLYLSQRLGPSSSLLLGKINAVDLLANDPFFGGWGIRRFWNIAFVAPPSGVLPPVIMGAIVKHQVAPYTLTAMVFDPNDRTNSYSLEGLFSDGVNISLSGAWSGQVDGRPTSAALTGTFSTKDGTDLSQIVLPPGLRTGAKAGSYNISLQAGHLLIESPAVPGKGLGIYAKAAIADGNPNPIRASFVGGIAGHHIVPGRPQDSFGVGYYWYDFSDALEEAIEPVAPFGDEQGIEAYYRLAVAPWFRVTADLQIVNPAREDSEREVVAGLGANIAF